MSAALVRLASRFRRGPCRLPVAHLSTHQRQLRQVGRLLKERREAGRAPGAGGRPNEGVRSKAVNNGGQKRGGNQGGDNGRFTQDQDGGGNGRHNSTLREFISSSGYLALLFAYVDKSVEVTKLSNELSNLKRDHKIEAIEQAAERMSAEKAKAEPNNENPISSWWYWWPTWV